MANHKKVVAFEPIYNRKIIRNMFRKKIGSNKFGKTWKRLKEEGRI